MDHASILHIDGDDFFAATARLKDAALRHRPLIIGHLESRGAVVSSSYEARYSGVHPGLTMDQAKRMCPEAVLVQIDWELIHRVSNALHHIVNRYSPLIEPVGADAVFLDYTGCRQLFGPATDFANRIRKEIADQINISVSVGLASDKAVSVVACRAAKTGMLEAVESGSEQRFLSGCPTHWLPGIDARLAAYFTDLGIRTIGELARIPVEVMKHILGNEGRVLAIRARGIEGSRVRAMVRGDAPIVTAEFKEDVIEPCIILARFASLASELGDCLRRTRQAPRYIVLRIGYSDFRISRIQMPLTPPSNRDPDIFRIAREAFTRLYQRRVRVREISIQATHLIGYASELPFGEAEKRIKWDRALIAIDQVRHKHSLNALLLAATLG